MAVSPPYTPNNADAAAILALIKSYEDTAGAADTPTFNFPKDLRDDGYSLAFVDAVAQSSNFYAQSEQTCSTASAVPTTTFANLPGTVNASITVPVTRLYKIGFTFGFYLTGMADVLLFQVTVDGSAPAGQPSFLHIFQTLSFHYPLGMWVIGATMAAGTRNLRLQFRNLGAVGSTLNVDGNDRLLWTVW